MEPNGPLDPGTLAKLRAIGRHTGKDLVAELVEMFLDKEPGVLEEVLAAAERGDLAAVHETVHQMRSSAATMGALRLFDLCGKAENLAEAGALDALPEALARLQAEFDLVCQALRAEKERPPDG